MLLCKYKNYCRAFGSKKKDIFLVLKRLGKTLKETFNDFIENIDFSPIDVKICQD